jgi:putative endonuclease
MTSELQNNGKNNSTKQQSWHLYLIRNKLNQLYCGISTDVNRRFREHSSSSKKGAKALKGKGPLILEFHIEVGTKPQASKLEAQVKKLKKTSKETLLISQITELVKFKNFIDCHLCKR